MEKCGVSVLQAVASAVPAGGPDDASLASEMAGLEIKDGAPPRSDDESEALASGEGSSEGQQGRCGSIMVISAKLSRRPSLCRRACT